MRSNVHKPRRALVHVTAEMSQEMGLTFPSPPSKLGFSMWCVERRSSRALCYSNQLFTLDVQMTGIFALMMTSPTRDKTGRLADFAPSESISSTLN